MIYLESYFVNKFVTNYDFNGRIYMEQIRGAYPNYTEDQLSALKENEFVNWLKFYVSFLKSILYYF